MFSVAWTVEYSHSRSTTALRSAMSMRLLESKAISHERVCSTNLCLSISKTRGSMYLLGATSTVSCQPCHGYKQSKHRAESPCTEHEPEGHLADYEWNSDGVQLHSSKLNVSFGQNLRVVKHLFTGAHNVLPCELLLGPQSLQNKSLFTRSWKGSWQWLLVYANAHTH